MNRHERARLTMAKCSISEGEEQIAHLSELIKVLELRGNKFAAARARKLLEDFRYDLTLAYADLNVIREDTQYRKSRTG
jgi:hypothetical protein